MQSGLVLESLDVNWSIKIDQLSSVMLVVVTLVSAIVHIYSRLVTCHMILINQDLCLIYHYLHLQCLVLVTSDNFFQLFFGWEGVGLCSYFLIGFWFKKPTANAAAIKAFIVNRVGDFGFALGIFLIFYIFGTVNYEEVFNQVSFYKNINLNFLGLKVNSINLICFLFLLEQWVNQLKFFLHTWLPDAMEGPTPVSALIHAATMVTAGVFLVVRCSPIYEFSPTNIKFYNIIGMTTALFAATVALVQNDIKK